MCDGQGCTKAMVQEADPRYRQLTTEEVEKIAAVCHDANRAFRAGIGEDPGEPWEHARPYQRESAIDGVAKLLERGGAPLMAFGQSPGEALHNSWMEHKLRAGWRYGPEKSETCKVHPCLLPWAALPEEQRRKDQLYRAIVLALDPRRPVEG